MVDLDEQIKKDKQKNRQQKPNQRKPIHGRGDRRDRGFKSSGRIFPSDKHRGIRKDDRRPNNNDRNDRRNRINRPPKISTDDNRSGRKEHRGSRIRRDNDRKRIPRPPRKDSEGNTPDAVQQKGRTLKVMGLHPDFTNQDLYKLFSTEGALQKCLIEQDNFGRSMTTAIVKYHNAASAKSAIANLNQHKVMNIILTVQPYKNIRK